jgi:hypothetical protein
MEYTEWLNETEDEERETWSAAAAFALARAYAEDEPEYPPELIKEWNPEFRHS